MNNTGGRGRSGPGSVARKPDSIFTASGRGLKGTITQWRWGIEAKIGLDIESDEPNRQAWIFPVNDEGGSSLLGILALPHSSRILQFAKDFSQVQEVDGEDIQFDLSCRTIFAMQQSDDSVLQITEAFISVVGPTERYVRQYPAPHFAAANSAIILIFSSKTPLAELLQSPDICIDRAHCLLDGIILSVQERDQAKLFMIRWQDYKLRPVANWEINGEITAVCLFSASGTQLAAVASINGGQPQFTVYALDGELVATTAVSADGNSPEHSMLEAVTSICAVEIDPNVPVLVMGTRCGHLITMRTSQCAQGQLPWITETLGISPVEIFPAPEASGRKQMVFASCDSNLVMLSDYSPRKRCFCTKSVVVPTDSNDLGMPSPPVHSICCLNESLSGHSGHTSLLMLAGSRILMTDIWPHIGHIPRCIPLEGTPSRVIYSRTWRCLVVAVIKYNRPTLEFIDPDTGAAISDPSDKDQNSSEFISGLGHEGDRIFGLHEWLYVKDGRTFSFILVTTKDGRLLIVSLKETPTMTEDGPSRRLKYWTRYKKLFTGQIGSIVGDADGLIFCVDRTLHWEVLDLVDKKLKPMKEYELDSTVVSLRIVDGKIHALTLTNSLEIIEHRTGTGTDMALLHTDQVARRTVHMMDIGCSREGSEAGPVTLLADYKNGFAGVWVPTGQDSQELQTVFEGLLPSSVRRFVRSWSRPPWVAADRSLRFGALRSSNDGAEMLGVTLDGALHQFTLIEVELWRLLSLIQTLAYRSPILYPLYNPALGDTPADEDTDLEPQLHPRLMHIDGDILQKCLEGQLLEKLLGDGDGLDLFCEYLDGIEGGLCTVAFRDSTEEEGRHTKYFEVAYDILGYLLAPAL